MRRAARCTGSRDTRGGSAPVIADPERNVHAGRVEDTGARSRAARPWSAAARWTIGAEALAAAVWLYAYSFPAPSLVAQLTAAAVSLVAVVAALGWAVTSATRARGDRPEQDTARSDRPAPRATAVLVAVAVLTFALCAVRVPMWTRFAEAVPQMLWLAHRAQPPTRSGALAPAWAGTYHFGDVHRSASGYVEYSTDASGILQFASYVYSPGEDPRSLDVEAGSSEDHGVHYRHLLGPWWAETSDDPGT